MSDQPAPEVQTVDAKELERLRHVDEVAQKIRAQQEKVSNLHDEWKRKADASLAAKKSYDEQNATLIEMIKELSDPQQRLPFPDGAPLNAAAPQPVTDGWELAPIAILGLSQGLQDRLGAHCKTLGDLEARRRDKGRALDIDGIGEKGADKINDAMDNWLRENRDKAAFDAAAAPPVEAAPPAPAEPTGHFLLTQDVVLSDTETAKAGSIFPVTETMADGRLFLGSGDAGFAVKPDEGRYVQAEERATLVQITAPVPGSDNEQDKQFPGAEAEVVGWHGSRPIVKAASGREVMVTEEEWKPLKTALQEVAA